MSTLLEHSSERYIANISQFTSTPERQYVIALVEGKQDPSFWEKVFAKYSTRYHVIVKTNHDYHPDNSDGKYNLLRTVTPSKGMAVCVDADHDLWINGYSAFTQMVRTHPHVFHTVYHSLENILLQDEHVGKVMMGQQVDASSVSEYAEFLQVFSSAIYPRLMDYLAEIQEAKDGGKSGDELHDIHKRFHEDLAQLHLQLSNFREACARYQADYVPRYPEEHRREIADRLAASTIYPEDCYKAVRGHHMMRLSLLILKRIFNNSRANRFRELRAQQPTLTKAAFDASLGEYVGVEELIESLLRTTPVDEVCVPAKLRERLDAIYGDE
jgi:hypothetical protein